MTLLMGRTSYIRVGEWGQLYITRKLTTLHTLTCLPGRNFAIFFLFFFLPLFLSVPFYRTRWSIIFRKRIYSLFEFFLVVFEKISPCKYDHWFFNPPDISIIRSRVSSFSFQSIRSNVSIYTLLNFLRPVCPLLFPSYYLAKKCDQSMTDIVDSHWQNFTRNKNTSWIISNIYIRMDQDSCFISIIY